MSTASDEVAGVPISSSEPLAAVSMAATEKSATGSTDASDEIATVPATPVGKGFHSAAFWRRFAHLGAARGPRFFVRFAPPVIGLIFFVLLPAARRAITRNLRRIFGERDAWQESLDVARTFQNFAACLTESLGALRSESKRAHVHVRGAARIDELLERKTGFVITTAHVGPWDGAAQALAKADGARVMIVMAREDDAGAEALHDQVRGNIHVEVLRIGHHPLDALPALLHLQQGGIVALQLDRVPTGSTSIETRLFDAPFFVPAGPFLLAGLARVPLVPVFSARTGFFSRRIEVGRAVSPPRRPTPAELERLAAAAVAQMEEHIRVYPTQWFHFGTEPHEGN